MAVNRDYAGLRKAKEHGWVYVMVSFSDGKIFGGCYLKPTNSLKKLGLDIFTVKDYELIISPQYDPSEAVMAAEWYDMIDWKILGVANIIVNN